MSKKGIYTEADPMSWNDLQNLISRMSYDIDNSQINESKRKLLSKFLLLISIGCYCGLRASDLLRLRWKEVVEQKHLELIEKKTGKKRSISLNQNLINIINKQYQTIKPIRLNDLIFCNKTGEKSFSIQYVNKKLKSICLIYKIKVKNPSTHTLRKSFGKRVYEMNFKSEDALITLSHIFNHSSISITRRYIGIQSEKIRDIYLNL
jgi:integrase